MNEKIRRSILALYGVVGIKIVTVAIAIGWYFQQVQQVELPDHLKPNPIEIFGMSVAWCIFLAIAVVKTVEHLKQKHVYAWVAAISILIVTMFSYALPVSLIGLLALLDEEVRKPYLDKLDIKI